MQAVFKCTYIQFFNCSYLHFPFKRDQIKKKRRKILVENVDILVGMSRIFIKDYKCCEIFNYNSNNS